MLLPACLHACLHSWWLSPAPAAPAALTTTVDPAELDAVREAFKDAFRALDAECLDAARGGVHAIDGSTALAGLQVRGVQGQQAGSWAGSHVGGSRQPQAGKMQTKTGLCVVGGGSWTQAGSVGEAPGWTGA